MENTNKNNIVIVTLSWGLLAHGYAMYNKLSWHDDQVALFGIGGTYGSGRWMLGVLGEMVRYVFGGSNYSLPTFSGMVTIFLLALPLFYLSACIM